MYDRNTEDISQILKLGGPFSNLLCPRVTYKYRSSRNGSHSCLWHVCEIMKSALHVCFYQDHLFRLINGLLINKYAKKCNCKDQNQMIDQSLNQTQSMNESVIQQPSNQMIKRRSLQSIQPRSLNRRSYIKRIIRSSYIKRIIIGLAESILKSPET